MKDELLTKIYNSNRNLVVDGEMSTGKTLNVSFPLINKIINKKESFLVIDSKEEYLNRYYNTLKEKGYNTIVINLRDYNKSDGWNMLDYPYKLYLNKEFDKSLAYLEQISSEIFKEPNTYRDNSASDFFKGLALGLFEDGKKDEVNISSINSMINAYNIKFLGKNDNYLEEYFSKKNKTEPAYDYVSSTIFAPLVKKAEIIATVKQNLNIINGNKSLLQLLNKTTFDYQNLINKPTAIFFVLKDEDTSLSFLASIFIKQLYSILIDNKIQKKFNFVLDNFDSIGTISKFNDLLSSCIARNIKFTLVTRSKMKLESEYGEYINKLINTIEVTETKLEIKINTNIISIDNSYNQINNRLTGYRNPTLRKMEIKTFNVKKYVDDKKFEHPKIINHRQEIFPKITKFEETKKNKIEIQKKSQISYELENLLKKIDEKIIELENQEKELELNNQKIRKRKIHNNNCFNISKPELNLFNEDSFTKKNDNADILIEQVDNDNMINEQIESFEEQNESPTRKLVNFFSKKGSEIFPKF